MAIRKRTVIGSIYKGMQKKDPYTDQPMVDKDGKPVLNADYMKLRTDKETKEALIQSLNKVDSNKGLVIQLQSKKQQLEGVEYSVTHGKLSEKAAGEIRERINKIPDYVRFELVLISSD